MVLHKIPSFFSSFTVIYFHARIIYLTKKLSSILCWKLVMIVPRHRYPHTVGYFKVQNNIKKSFHTLQRKYKQQSNCVCLWPSSLSPSQNLKKTTTVKPSSTYNGCNTFKDTSTARDRNNHQVWICLNISMYTMLTNCNIYTMKLVLAMGK